MKEFIYYIAMAFISSACLIILSKIVMSSFMRKDKDYYEAGERKDEAELLKNIDYVPHGNYTSYLPFAMEPGRSVETKKDEENTINHGGGSKPEMHIIRMGPLSRENRTIAGSREPGAYTTGPERKSHYRRNVKRRNEDDQ